MANRKTNTLSLKSKIDLIKCSEEQKLSPKQLVLRFKCGKTQVYEILKNKDKIKEEWMRGSNGDVKRKPKENSNEDINSTLLQWFMDARTRNLPVSGPILQEKAKEIAQHLGKQNFKASNGWLESFRSRHKIKFNQVCGEAKDVNPETVSEWTLQIKEIIKGYKLEDIANCDETGLFYRALPDKTMCFKNEKCQGGKHSKERLTILLCAFADGKIEKPLVIGKSLRPRCFNNANVLEFPVYWRANKKAWMTSILMDQWLKILNQKMKCQKRNIILFLDNASCHPKVNLSNIKLCFLPPNTTSHTQPLDQGIIQNFKMHYRTQVLRSIIANMTSSQSAGDLAKKISVLDAIRWIDHSVKNIKPDCVKKCFSRCGIKFDEELNETFNELVEDSNEIEELVADINSNINVHDYVTLDEAVITNSGFQSLEELLQEKGADEMETDDENDGIGIGK